MAAKKLTAKKSEKKSGEKEIVFGLKQVLKMFKGKKKPEAKVFVSKDAREQAKKALEKAEIPFETAKTKVEITQDFGIDFFCEVYAVK